MTVDTYQKYQEKVEAAASMLCQLKQIYQLNTGHEYMAIPSVKEFFSCVQLPSARIYGFLTDISDGVIKMRAAAILGDIVRLHQHTKIH